MLVPFWKVTPSGNPTILFRTQDIPADRRAPVANAAMNEQHIGGEQVGYVRFEGMPRLDMMGGEFCLNATRAFASVLDELGLLSKEELVDDSGHTFRVGRGIVEVSGASAPVEVRVVRREGALPCAEACLHFNELPRAELIAEGLILVRVPGIAHLIQSGDVPDSALLDGFCSDQRKAYGLEKEEAVGHLWLTHGSPCDEEYAPIPLELFPAVWVRDTATLCRESACGSGTLACALAEHAKSGMTRFSVLQPSGIPLSVSFEKSDRGWDIWVGGPSRITARGEADLTGIL